MKKIDKFLVSGLLGRGGMGKIFKIEYPVTGKIAALKLLDPPDILLSLMGKEKIEEIFTREAVTMAKIRHPNVVDILDFDRFEDKLYYIIDFFCNDLGKLIGEIMETQTSRIITIEKAVHYTRQTLSGLACLHYAGVIHRDIKPANILITDNDDVKICDFGLSKLRGEDFVSHGSIRIGSPFYAAPEQEKDHDNVDVTADLYSVGIMLFRLLTGRLPMNKSEKASSHNHDLDEAWDQFILKAMDNDPEKRFQTADSMIHGLDNLNQMWLEKKERICALPPESLVESEKILKTSSIRSHGKKISRKEAGAVFNLNDLMMPEFYTFNDFEKRSPGIIIDHATGLAWQESGTRFPVTWKGADEYINMINQENLGGCNTWRMPTINELLTILSKTPTGLEHCIAPAFSTHQKWLWSADRCTYISAWYVSLDMGFISFNDFSSYYHVKAVSAALPELS